MKNPKECVCIQQKQTFFILNELTAPEYKDGSEPLLFHHDIFSRFSFVLINEEKKAATANISVKEIPGIFRRVRNLELKEMLSSGKEKGETAKSPAYTTVITSGKLRGKIASARYYLEEIQERKDALEKEMQPLKDSVEEMDGNDRRRSL